MRNALLFCTLIVASPAIGQTTTSSNPAAPSVASQLKAGATISDATGAEVGTVDQVNGNVVIVNTGTNRVGVPLGNFAAGPNGPVLGNTKAQLDAAAAQSAAEMKAKLQSLLVVGTPVHGTGGVVLGTVKTVTTDLVTVTTDGGASARLPISGFAAGPDGLVFGITAAQFQAAVGNGKAK